MKYPSEMFYPCRNSCKLDITFVFYINYSKYLSIHKALAKVYIYYLPQVILKRFLSFHLYFLFHCISYFFYSYLYFIDFLHFIGDFFVTSISFLSSFIFTFFSLHFIFFQSLISHLILFFISCFTQSLFFLSHSSFFFSFLFTSVFNPYLFLHISPSFSTTSSSLLILLNCFIPLFLLPYLLCRIPISPPR